MYHLEWPCDSWPADELGTGQAMFWIAGQAPPGDPFALWLSFPSRQLALWLEAHALQGLLAMGKQQCIMWNGLATLGLQGLGVRPSAGLHLAPALLSVG